jgi:hypothetical protein
VKIERTVAAVASVPCGEKGGGPGFPSISILRYQSIGVRLNLVRIRAGQNSSTPSIFWRRLLPCNLTRLLVADNVAAPQYAELALKQFHQTRGLA